MNRVAPWRYVNCRGPGRTLQNRPLQTDVVLAYARNHAAERHLTFGGRIERYSAPEVE